MLKMRKTDVGAIRERVAVSRYNGLGLRRAKQDEVLAELSVPVALEAAFERRLDEIDADERLTGEGKADAARGARAEMAAGVQKWVGPRLAGLAAQERAVRAELSALAAAPKPSDPAEALTFALVRHEIRLAAGNLDDLQAETLFRLGDATTRAALMEGPRVVKGSNGFLSVRPFIPDVLRDQILIETAGRLRPDLADTLHDVAEVKDLYSSIAATLQRIGAEVAPMDTRPAPASPPEIRIL